MNDECGFVAKHAARHSSSASPISKSNKVQAISGVIWPRSRFEERSQDAGNQLEQIGHHLASLLHLILGLRPNRVFGRYPAIAKLVTSQLPVSQSVQALQTASRTAGSYLIFLIVFSSALIFFGVLSCDFLVHS